MGPQTGSGEGAGSTVAPRGAQDERVNKCCLYPQTSIACTPK